MIRCAEGNYGFLNRVQTPFDTQGWQLNSSVVRLHAGIEAPSANTYFVRLYQSLAAMLDGNGDGLFGLEGREHTAQVDQDRRQWRENRFRYGKEDREFLAENPEAMASRGDGRIFASSILFSNDGAGRRYLRAKRGLSA